MNKQFARIVEASDGCQLLSYVETDYPEVILHQIVNCDGFQADAKMTFSPKEKFDTDEAEDAAVEKLREKALELMNKIDQAAADKLYGIMRNMMANNEAAA